MLDPATIVGPHVSEGMTVLEPGPGMRFFTLEMASRVGPSGRVIAIDVQPKMVEGLVRRAQKAGFAGRIEARQPKGDHIGIEDYLGKVDFALAFAMVHEVAKPRVLLADIYGALKVKGRLLFAEPVGHVRSEEYQATLALAKEVGFWLESRPMIRRSQATVLVKE
jgi:ubiquinone/menaquinone biosynthesis C-methylase UbiE